MEKFLEGIEKTGFELEYLAAEILMEDGWTVISNKYYIDDVQRSAREIDIIAYKVTQQNQVQVYTVLIVSCKKSADRSWALLSKEKNLKDPNVDWSPVTLWSNNKISKLIIDKFNWKDKYVENETLSSELFFPKSHIFAFQELSNKNGSPQNDKAIFNSVVSAMKSQNYEIDSLSKRKKQEAIYNFNIISLVDAPLYKINYRKNNKEIEQVKSDIYISSYIIDQKETASRIDFVNFENFTNRLNIYNLLHDHNVGFSTDIFNIYYSDCLKHEDKIKIYIKDFNKEVKWKVFRIIRKDIDPEYKVIDFLDIKWDFESDCAVIMIENDWDDEFMNDINKNSKIASIISTAFKEIYKYEGSFRFDPKFPF